MQTYVDEGEATQLGMVHENASTLIVLSPSLPWRTIIIA